MFLFFSISVKYVDYLIGFCFHILCRLSTSDNLLASIQEKIRWADTMSDIDRKHKKEVNERVEELKKTQSLKVSYHDI